jgi:cytochrome c peroxidase
LSGKLWKIAFVLLLVGCSQDEQGDEYVEIPENEPLDFVIPTNFPEPTYEFSQNPPTEKGFALGKKLFYDGRLSSTGVISCGFCHIQDFAFTHHTHIVSHGVNGALGTRNAPSLANMAFMEDFMWDGSVEHLDLQPIVPITAEVEMNESINNVLEKLKNDPEYVKMFAAAFENDTINTENMLNAISQFVVMMVSANTKYDRVVRGEGAFFTSEEEQGKALFEQKCASCHAGVLFADQSYRNNGLPIDPQYNDIGRMNVTGLEADKYKFKVPSLRNVAITFPYMHDGRFRTLIEVLDHYDSGMVSTQNLDPIFQEGETLGIPLTEDEKLKLIAFLETLTDDDFIFDERFSEF